MNSSSIAENGTATATAEVSTFQIKAGGCVQSPAMKWRHHFARQIDLAIRATLQDNGLHTKRIEAHHERTGKKYFRRYIYLTVTCLVECSADEMERVSRELRLAMRHLPATRVKLRDIFAGGEIHPSRA